MSNRDKTVLVTGATGRQGGAVIRHMLPKGWRLRALTRNPASHAAKDLARQGVEVVQGDLEATRSLEEICHGIYGIYSVQDFWSVGAKREIQQGKNLADAAKKVGVEHFVYSSVGGAERNATRAFPTGRASGRSKSTSGNSPCPPQFSVLFHSWRRTTFLK